ncbi:MAG: hypothetical protein JO299_08050 [Gammaproteobacteria bacterium]|nr:hypothetical protein [Gammaproteobacteria bacterium]
MTRFTRHTIMLKRELFALIADAKVKGYSINYEELEDGLVNVSVPVFNRLGLGVAALNASIGSVRAK